jgi:hypothetical protein
MDRDKMKNTISMMYVDVITGDVNTHNQYMNTLISYIVVSIKRNKLEPRQPAIEKFRSRLHDTVNMILNNNHPLPAADEKREVEIRKLMGYFDRFVIKVDSTVADETGLDQIELLKTIETLEYARNICYSARSDYSDYLSGLPNGLTLASNKYAVALDLIIPIIDNYDIAELDSNGYAASEERRRKSIEATARLKNV